MNYSPTPRPSNSASFVSSMNPVKTIYTPRPYLSMQNFQRLFKLLSISGQLQTSSTRFQYRTVFCTQNYGLSHGSVST